MSSYYVFLINFSHNMLHLWQTANWKLTDLDLTFQCRPRSIFLRCTEMPYMTYYICFIQTLILRCTIYEIQPVESYVTSIYLWRSYKVNGVNGNWNIIYDFEYMFHRSIGHSMHHFWYISSNRSLMHRFRDISWNISQRSTFDLLGLENDL